MAIRVAPIEVTALSLSKDFSGSASVIFLHGLGDNGAAFQDIAHQIHNANKLLHVNWVFPTALENRDAMDTAWFYPTPLNAVPSSRPELEDDEDEDGMLASVHYVETLIDREISKGIPVERIVVGGFSQGCAISLLVALTSKYSGKIAGACGLAGSLPLPGSIGRLREAASLPTEVGHCPIFFTRGSRDMLVPRRFYTTGIERLQDLGVRNGLLEPHEYEGLGHTISGAVIRDMCTWLEKIVPSS